MQDRHLIVGLGNPGIAYRQTRHNVGFMAVERIAAANGMTFRSSRRLPDIRTAHGRIDGVGAVLAKPMAFMNRSGPPIFRLAEYLGIRCKAMIVLCDDIDLAFGRVRIKEKGGHGGHKGLKSLIDVFGRDDFVRLRMGIGRPADGSDVVDYVLGKFDKSEIPDVEEILRVAREAVAVFLRDGITAAMNQFNGLRVIRSR
jgi:PTH1 family peptidyl-tRNA hydrolase